MPVHMIQIDLAEYVQGFTAQKEKTLDPSEVQLVMEQEEEILPGCQCGYRADPTYTGEPSGEQQEICRKKTGGDLAACQKG